ncbi:MAG TPA: hypothetical protein VFI29_02875 [Hanamia sp.]|nr:hypothetical protein [Hanamia sp.]
MKLQIEAGTKIKELQKKISKTYPYLKVEFYKQPYSEMKVSEKKDRMLPDEIISEQSDSFEAEKFDINRNRTVGAVEKEFYEKFGIAMQVSRRSGNIWIETSKTDNRTLKAQNQLGKSMNSSQAQLIPEEEFEK